MQKFFTNILKKLNNKGASLVEILVAVVIFSFAVAPVMSSFIVSANMTAKASIRQRATNAAQQIMENFKAYPLDKVYDHFVNADFLDNNTATYSMNGVSEASNYLGTYEINNFTFSDASFVTEGTDVNFYDATITVSEGAAQSLRVEDATDAGIINAVTEDDILNLGFMDASQDVIYEADMFDNYFMDSLKNGFLDEIDNVTGNAIVSAKAQLASKGYNTNINEDDNLFLTGVSIDSLKRDMTLDIGSSFNLGFKYTYTGTATWHVTSVNGAGAPVVVVVSCGFSGDFTSSPVSNVNAPTSGVARNVYFFYYPLYGSGVNYSLTCNLYDVSGLETDSNGKITNNPEFFNQYIAFVPRTVGISSVSDSLIVNGSCDNIFLYKQVNTSSYITSLSTAEGSYKLNGSGPSGACLYTNLGDDISGVSNTVPASPFADSMGVTSTQYNATTKLFEGDMSANTETTQMIYSIKVEVREHKDDGEIDPKNVAVVDGTRVDKIIK
ncbi:MAG: hypothetical protein KBS85_07525 [Lachnospiraceae bacterium]|nr:hypothetical protein [Candidatus Merdinaster equi]